MKAAWLALLLSVGDVLAQPAGIPRAAVLYASQVGTAKRLAALREGLRDLGYVDGRTIIVEPYYAEGDLARFPVIAAEAVQRNPAVLISGGPAATRALHAATKTIPIVMIQDNDPIGSGFIASLARPGGNVTGLSNEGAVISAKQLGMLKDVIPGLKTVAVLGTLNEPAIPSALAATRRAAVALGLTLHYLDVPAPGDFAAAFRAAADARVDAVLLLATAVGAGSRKEIAALALERRLPTMDYNELGVEVGTLMTYGTRLTDLDRRAAGYVHKILRGAKPAELPVEQPTRFDLTINARTARAIGLRIPPSVLLKADRVIE